MYLDGSSFPAAEYCAVRSRTDLSQQAPISEVEGGREGGEGVKVREGRRERGGGKGERERVRLKERE